LLRFWLHPSIRNRFRTYTSTRLLANRFTRDRAKTTINSESSTAICRCCSAPYLKSLVFAGRSTLSYLPEYDHAHGNRTGLDPIQSRMSFRQNKPVHSPHTNLCEHGFHLVTALALHEAFHRDRMVGVLVERRSWYVA
jgi:hypothetical protein